MPRGTPMTPDDLRAILQSEKRDALAADQAATLSDDRERATKYYLGDVAPDIPTPTDRSKAVSMDVSDTIEGMMPALMEIFASGDQVAQFDPVGPEDEEAAAQETDYINHVFMNQNPGWMVIYTMIKDALLSKVGTVKVWWDETETEEEETYTNLSDDEYALLVANPDIEIIEHVEHSDDIEGEPSELNMPDEGDGVRLV